MSISNVGRQSFARHFHPVDDRFLIRSHMMASRKFDCKFKLFIRAFTISYVLSSAKLVFPAIRMASMPSALFQRKRGRSAHGGDTIFVEEVTYHIHLLTERDQFLQSAVYENASTPLNLSLPAQDIIRPSARSLYVLLGDLYTSFDKILSNVRHQSKHGLMPKQAWNETGRRVKQVIKNADDTDL